MPSIPLFHLELSLGPDDKVDLLPRKPTEPQGAFVPWRHKYLTDVFSGLQTPQTEVKAKRDILASKDSNRRSGRSKKDSPPEVVKPTASVESRGQKRQLPEESLTGKEVWIECELVPSNVNGETHLGTIGMGSGAYFFDTLAVVAMPPPKLAIPRTIHPKQSYEDRLVKTAWKQRHGDRPAEEADGILLGHIVPGCLKAAHPIKHIHSTLMRSQWVTTSKCKVQLEAPYLSMENAQGISSAHPCGRAVEEDLIDLEDDGNSRTIWRDPVTKHFWRNCPHEMTPAAQLFGKLTIDVQISESALKYGSKEQDDGFVDSFSVQKRDLALYSKLKDLVIATIKHKDGLLSYSDNVDTFWSRTPQKYYDEDSQDDPGKVLTLDNRLDTALESTRPKVTSPMLEPGSAIKSQLMPFQKKALAWMVEKEQKTTQDEGALLPNWKTVNITTVSSDDTQEIVSKRRKKNERKEMTPSNQIYFDSLTGAISFRRMASRGSEPGGCLCDSMGLGKSLSTLSLIETHQRTPLYIDQTRSANLIATLDKQIKPFACNSTLLVVPASLVHQWYSEMNKHLQIDADEDDINDYLLRYKRGITIPWSAYDERNDIRRQTRSLFANQKQYTIVIATYEDLRAELQASKKLKKAISPLLEIHWWRIMLDEAQLVSTSNGSAAEMVNCLWRTNGWIITSTPFNSSIGDLHGLLTFLDSDFASKKLFEEMIVEPFNRGDANGIKAAHSVLKRIMWRHRKEHVESELGLPPSSNEILLLEQSGLEKTLYDREYKKMLETVQNAVGLGRGLTKKQQDRLIALRKMISHPQLAAQLGYGSSGNQRTTFANLFADLIFRNQSEIHGAKMEFITVALRIGAGKRFRKVEKDSSMWKGGSSTIAHFDVKLHKAHTYASEGVARIALHKKEVSTRGGNAEDNDEDTSMEVDGAKEPEGDNETFRMTQEAVEEARREDGEAEGGTAEAVTAESTRLRHDEALYWLSTLLHPKDKIEPEVGVKVDPDRLVNLFFERKVVEAETINLEDPRYNPILLDAGDDEEEQQQGESSRKNSPTVLLKNRFRGNQKREVQKVWYYHPRRKLQSLCREMTSVEAKIDRLQREGAYLENRIHEELGVERARLALKEGFDALKSGSNSSGEDSTCILCLDVIDLPGILPCLHTACYTCLKDCLNKMAGSDGQSKCPMCRKDFSSSDIIEVLPAITETDHVDQFGVKISGLIIHIRKQMESNPQVKIVVFSAWSSYLVMLTEALNNLKEPILSVAFSGKNQSQALKKFQKNDNIRIMLVPMKMAEGAAGLTLNFASIAYLLEPSLDSTLEDQALGRLNRIGQKAKKTTYYRVLVKNTIEPALVEIAERRLKEQNDKEADLRHHDTLSVDELAYVFGLNVEEEKARKKRELAARGLGSGSAEENPVEVVDLTED